MTAEPYTGLIDDFCQETCYGSCSRFAIQDARHFDSVHRDISVSPQARWLTDIVMRLAGGLYRVSVSSSESAICSLSRVFCIYREPHLVTPNAHMRSRLNAIVRWIIECNPVCNPSRDWARNTDISSCCDSFARGKSYRRYLYP